MLDWSVVALCILSRVHLIVPDLESHSVELKIFIYFVLVLSLDTL